MNISRLITNVFIVLVTTAGLLAFSGPKSGVYCLRPLSAGPRPCTGEATTTKTMGLPTHYGYIKLTNCTPTCKDQLSIAGE